MRNPQGALIITDPGAETREFDTITCCHCNTIVVIAHRCAPEDAGGFCRMCFKPTCKACAAHGRCTPFEAKLEAQERQYETRRSLGLV